MTTTKSNVVPIDYAPRLPVPVGVDPDQWLILCEDIFPGVPDARAIMRAITYCKVRGLDIMKRPVNIVPMWSSALRKEVWTIWPSINETHITAARTGWAGLDRPTLGPMRTETFTGRRKERDGNWVDARTTLTFPDWCEITVYRIIAGEPRAFTERVYWLESYGRVGGSDYPNPTWQRRTIGQLTKVAKAAALRAAFPEEESGNYTADEMEGGVIGDDQAPTIAHAPAPEPEPEPDRVPDLPTPQTISDPEFDTVDPVSGEIKAEPRTLVKQPDVGWEGWAQIFLGYMRESASIDEMENWKKTNADNLQTMRAENAAFYKSVVARINKLLADKLRESSE